MTTLEGNKLIAEFMGWKGGKYHNLPNKLHKIEDGGEMGIHVDQLQYHSSWDWLMPVVEKIYLQRSVNDVIIRPGKTIIELKDGLIFSSPHLPENNSIIECWHCLLQFIQWYNSQSKTDNNDNATTGSNK